MSRTLTASDRSSLIKQASSLPVGSTERKAILASLDKTSADWKAGNMGMAGARLLVLSLDNGQTIQIRTAPEVIESITRGEVVKVLVDLGSNDEVPVYVQNQLRETQAQLADALSKLSNVTKKF